jgi:two-component system, OmpR family, response regulator CpxR
MTLPDAISDGAGGDGVLPQRDDRGTPRSSGRSLKLLVIDDDRDLCTMLAQFLQPQDFSVEFEPSAELGLARTRIETFDLLILDVMLPGIDGFEALRQIRQCSVVPILMLTARTERRERVLGLHLGADDYLAKPFDPEELLARIRAILRRAGASRADPPETLQVGELVLLPGAREVYFRGEHLGLTAMECEILERLMRSRGRVVSRDELSLQLYNRPATAFDRSVDTHVSRIRRKLGQGPGMILGIRGIGYQLKYAPDADPS